jgi:hypothetical protein
MMNNDHQNKIDWNGIRDHAISDERPSDWPADIRAISLDGVSLFGLDKNHRLYWDGRLIEMRRTLAFTFWQKLGAVLTVTSALVVAFTSALANWENISGLFVAWLPQ